MCVVQWTVQCVEIGSEFGVSFGHIQFILWTFATYNINAFSAVFQIYTSYFLCQISGQISSVTIVNDQPKPERPMNRVLLPLGVRSSLFNNASR